MGIEADQLSSEEIHCGQFHDLQRALRVLVRLSDQLDSNIGTIQVIKDAGVFDEMPLELKSVLNQWYMYFVNLKSILDNDPVVAELRTLYA